MSRPIVIVGAGSSGSVLAARLTQHTDHEVVLLEAGPDYPPQQLPDDLADGRQNSMTRHDWGYRHKPNPKALLSPYPRGRVVGGSSAVNTCIALRGQPEDYDEWADLGLDDWGYERCLPAFKRLERDLDYGDPRHADIHGSDGPLPIRRHTPAELTPLHTGFLEACGQAGYPACHDSNLPGRAGYGPQAMNKIDGRRISAAEAYLTADVRGRDALRIVAGCSVRRVLFEGTRAVAVEVEHADRDGVERIEAAAVILCAGATNTPGILLRSGVGPDREVRRLQCDPVLDAPAVGARLLDHPGTGIYSLARRGHRIDHEDPIIQTILRYPSDPSGHRADMMIEPVSFIPIERKLPLFALVTSVGKPRGVGRMHYPDAGTHTKPVFEQNFFANADDRRLAMDAERRILELLRTPALRGIGRPIMPPPFVVKRSRLLSRALLSFCDSGYHPCGTVPMGTAPGAEAAVDARGRVFGARGLYVIDASVMPTIPSSNIHLPTLMIAERMAEFMVAEGVDA